jgi:hypothetical protein
MKTDEIAELLIKPVARSATSFLIRNLCGDPIAQMLLVFLGELRAPVSDTTLQNSSETK